MCNHDKLSDVRCVAVMRVMIPVLPFIPQAQKVSLDQVQDSLNPQPESEILLTASLQEQLLFRKKNNADLNHIKSMKMCFYCSYFTEFIPGNLSFRVFGCFCTCRVKTEVELGAIR